MFEFETTGTCRYGAGCRFAHVKISTESEGDKALRLEAAQCAKKKDKQKQFDDCRGLPLKKEVRFNR